MPRLVFVVLISSSLWAEPAIAQQGAGRIEGRVVREDGSGVGGVSVVLNELSLTDITQVSGVFTFGGVPAGTYSITLALGNEVRLLSEVRVTDRTTTRLEERVDWRGGFAETLTVTGASRRIERIVDAPAAVTSVPEAEIEQKASTGQLPKLIEFTPGAEVTQSGVYDFNFNTRGFNSSLTRRVAILIDGRDPSVPFLGSQEWAALPFPLDDIASLEFVRGPSAALYGANASSGVLNVTTKQPRYSRGGLVRFTGGTLATANLDLRWAGRLSDEWYAKVVAGSRSSGDFAVSRRGAAEYSTPCVGSARGDCLPQEPVALARVNDNNIYFGGLRFDRYFAGGSSATFEGGYADVAGPVLQTGVGRVQVLEARRPWARANWHADRFNVLASYNGRKTNRQLSLSSGGNLALDESAFALEGQTNWSFARDRVRLVIGASAGMTSIDTFDESVNRQSLLFEPVDSNSGAVFGQVDWKVTDQLKFVVAARGDFSTLHDAQLSPKGSVVYAFGPDRSVRLTFNKAFQVPNYSEFFLQADAAPPVNLAGLNAFCTPFGVNCGFGVTRVMAVGNADLDLEKVRTWEVGYSGAIGSRAFITLDYYNSVSRDFITDLIPQLGTPLGRVNPNFGPWQPPAGLPAPVASAISAQVPLLTNNLDGSSILVAVSYANFGTVDTQGIDFGLNYNVIDAWTMNLSYSWFDFTIEDELPGFASLLLPNSPEHKFSLGLGYSRPPLDSAISLRWVDDFRWIVGPFQGDVESYATVDVVANYSIARNWKVGVNLANLLDNRHWESFGGDVLRRRALASLTFAW